MDGGRREDRAAADGAAGSVQSRAEDCQEDNRSNDGFEREEVLDFRVRDAKERELQQEVKQESKHPGRRDALVFGDGIWYPRNTWPSRCEQDSHALSTGHRLNTRNKRCQ